MVLGHDYQERDHGEREQHVFEHEFIRRCCGRRRAERHRARRDLRRVQRHHVSQRIEPERFRHILLRQGRQPRYDPRRTFRCPLSFLDATQVVQIPKWESDDLIHHHHCRNPPCGHHCSGGDSYREGAPAGESASDGASRRNGIWGTRTGGVEISATTNAAATAVQTVNPLGQQIRAHVRKVDKESCLP